MVTFAPALTAAALAASASFTVRFNVTGLPPERLGGFAAHLRKLVGEHDARTADRQLGVQDPLAFRFLHPGLLFGAERLLAEIDETGAIAHCEVDGQAFDLFTHVTLLSTRTK